MTELKDARRELDDALAERLDLVAKQKDIETRLKAHRATWKAWANKRTR